MSDNPPVFRATASSVQPAASGPPSRGNFEATPMMQGLGVAGVQLGGGNPAAPVTGPQPMRPTSTHTGGVVRATVRNGNMTMETGLTVARATQEHPGANGGGIIGTIRSPMGVARSGADVRPIDVITVAPGVTTTVAAAEASGFITKDAQGNYSEVQAPADDKPQEPQQPAAEPVAALDEASEALMDNLVSSVGNLDLAHGLGHILAGTELPADLLARAGSRMGIEGEQVRQNVNHLVASFEAQAVGAVGEPVISWAKANKLDALRDAGRDHAMTGSLKGYDKIARDYMMALPNSDPGAIFNSKDAKARGVRQERDGTITLDIPSVGRVEWRAAIKAGFISPRFPSKAK